MADCNETLRELDRFLDNELASEVLGDMMHHLDQCVDCQQAFEFHAELRAVVKKAAGDEPLPDTLLDRIKQCFGTDLSVDADEA